MVSAVSIVLNHLQRAVEDTIDAKDGFGSMQLEVECAGNTVIRPGDRDYAYLTLAPTIDPLFFYLAAAS